MSVPRLFPQPAEPVPADRPDGRPRAGATRLPMWHDRAAIGLGAITALCLLAALVTGERTAGALHAAGTAVATLVTWPLVRRRASVRLLLVWPLLGFLGVFVGSFVVPVAASLTFGTMVIGFLFAGMTQRRGTSLLLLPPALIAQWFAINLPNEQASIRLLISLCVYTAVAELPAWLTDSLRSARRQLAREAATDPLTGLANRRAWEPKLGRLLEEARETRRPVTLLIADLDEFKAYNDQHGHLAGDDLLSRFAAGMLGVLPSNALAARWGGEEFVVAVPGLTLTEAVAVAERVRAAVPDGESCSVGLTLSRSDDTELTLLGRADAALYRAKDHGRDRVEAA